MAGNSDVFSQPAGKARLPRLGITVLSVILSVGAVELAGRWILTPWMVRYSDNQVLKLQLANPKDLGVASLYVPHHYYLYATRPSYRSADGKLRHNAMGCRAEEARIPKPPGVYRIVAVGGSTTYSTGVRSNEDTFGYRLERLLNEWSAGHGLGRSAEVLNCAVPGFTSAETLIRYVFALSEYRPDLVIVQQGLNDTLSRLLPHLSRDYGEFSKAWSGLVPGQEERWFVLRLARAARQRFSESVWTQGIQFMVRQPFWDKAATGADPVNFGKNSPRIFEANTASLVRLAQGDGAQVLLLSEHLVADPADKPTDWLPDGGIQAVLEHNRVLRRVAHEAGTLFLDLQTAMCACGAIMPDGRHLNEEGEARKAQAIFDYLTREFAAGRWALS